MCYFHVCGQLIGIGVWLCEYSLLVPDECGDQYPYGVALWANFMGVAKRGKRLPPYWDRELNLKSFSIADGMLVGCCAYL